MNMNELAEEYYYAIQRLTQQIDMLSDCLRRADAPRKKQALRSQLKSLQNIRREEQDIAFHLLHYYEPGVRRYEEYHI
jgi:hypothetical protein